MKACKHCLKELADPVTTCPNCGKDPGGPYSRVDTPPKATQLSGPVTAVSVVDFEMPFGSMVVFMIKWSLAAIPALIILFLASAVVLGILAAIGLTI